MKIVFLGTPEFAVASLDILVTNGYDIAAVITAPDKPAGRGQQLQQSAVKKYAEGKKLNTLQPVNLKDSAFLEELNLINADLFIVVAFRMLPEALWKMPPFGTFNLHASMLPDYRGAAPINWAIINGEKETGVTTFFLKQEIDTGEIIFQEKVPIALEDTAGTLHDKLKDTGAELVLRTVQAIDTGCCPRISQKELMKPGQPLHPAPKLTKQLCRIKWNESSESIYNFIRGLSSYPAAWTELKTAEGKALPIKIFKSCTEQGSNTGKAGSLLTDNKTYIKVHTADGLLELKEVQPAGKNKMNVKDFLNGHKLTGEPILH